MITVFLATSQTKALHLSERERKIILDCFSKLQYELEQAIDKQQTFDRV